MTASGLHILMVSVHGLIRGHQPELGRDPDTGGQVLYVLELARALARQPGVAQVDLLTRLVPDPTVSLDYARPEEPLAPNARILRIPFGPRRYIRKELLWDHLDQMVDGYLAMLRKLPKAPDLIHGHYADGGYVAMRLSSLLGIPFFQTGHSLGRCKKALLLSSGGREASLERQYHFSRRIQAEEEALSQASKVITSTRQEIQEQYAAYHRFNPRRAVAIPPGTDLLRFFPPKKRCDLKAIEDKVDRFLREPHKPVVLCISRPVPRKNILGLLQAFGSDRELREMANLVIVAGNRSDIRELDETSRNTWQEILLAIDAYDLHGHVAIPKNHDSEDIPDFYRLAMARKGICVNPSCFESFGLTLIEAAASGLPIVAADQGGPKDIIAHCRNGLLMDATQSDTIAAAIKEALSDPQRWAQWSRNGLRRVREIYTWDGHAARYLKVAQHLLRRTRKHRRRCLCASQTNNSHPLLSAEGVLVFDLDRTLIGNRESLVSLLHLIRELRGCMAFGITTGRKRESALRVLHEWGMDEPDFLISGVGSEIHYGPDWIIDPVWARHIQWKWRRDEVARVLESIPGLRPQAKAKCGPLKLSYHVSPGKFPGVHKLHALLNQQGLNAQMIYSQSRFLDVLPQRASKGQAVRHLACKWNIPLDAFIVAGDSGNDLDLLTGNTLGIVVGNHSQELAHLRGRDRIFFAQQAFAAGVQEGLEHYRLEGKLSFPEILNEESESLDTAVS